MASTNYQHVSSRHELQAPFSVSDRGLYDVAFMVEPDDDLGRHGLGPLGFHDDVNMVKGHAVVHGAVISPHPRIYASIYGWIRITNTPGKPHVMDNYLMFEDSVSPFKYWGSEPTIIDAPSRSDMERYDRVTKSFLCYTPDVRTIKRVVLVMAFQ